MSRKSSGTVPIVPPSTAKVVDTSAGAAINLVRDPEVRRELTALYEEFKDARKTSLKSVASEAAFWRGIQAHVPDYGSIEDRVSTTLNNLKICLQIFAQAFEKEGYDALIALHKEMEDEFTALWRVLREELAPDVLERVRSKWKATIEK